MEAPIIEQIINEIIETCIDGGTMPPETIETIAYGDSVEAVNETDNKATTTQTGLDKELKINEPLDELERDCVHLLRTFDDGTSLPDSIMPITCDDSSKAATESNSKAVVTQALEEIGMIGQSVYECDELIRTVVESGLLPESITTESDSKAFGTEADEEMDIIDQMEELERDGTFDDQTIQTILCDENGEALEECENEDIVTQMENGAHGEMDQLEVLERDLDRAKANDNGVSSTQCNEPTVSPVEMLSCSTGIKPQSAPEKARVVDSLRARGFSTAIYSLGKRKVCNLLLLQNASKFTPETVVCSGFPGTMTDNELILLFEECGQVFILKRVREDLMFVTYTNEADAERAVKLFNRRNIQGNTIKVSRYLQLTRLIVKGISPYSTKQFLFQKFGAATRELQSVQVFNDPMCEGRIRRYCFLQYGSYETARASAKRLRNFYPELDVQLANSQLQFTETPDTLYIINLHSRMCKQELKRLFSSYGKIISINLYVNLAKVRYERAEDAIRAAAKIDRRRLGNENVDITFFRVSRRRTDTHDRNYRQPSSEISRPSSFHTNDRIIRPTSFDTRDRRNIPPTSSVMCDSSNAQPSSYGTCAQNSSQSSSSTLYLKNLRRNIAVTDLRKCFSRYGEVISVDKHNNSASVNFRNKKDAERALAIDKSCFGDKAKISFVEQMETSDTLHIYNMSDDMTTERLRTLFSNYGDVMDIDLIPNGRATVGFWCKTNAERAKKGVDRSQLGKANVEILFYPMKKH